MDDARRICGPTRSSQNAWLKYIYALCGFVLVYFYIQVIHNGEKIMKIHKEFDSIKSDVGKADIASKLYRMETILNNMKREQDAHRSNMKNLITAELEKFSSDKTGRTDFALESTGGKIVNVLPGTENFDSAKTLFGITLCEGMHGPRAMLQADMSPGNCWAIQGSHGGVIVKLLGKVHINAVSLEHISQNISPTGEVSSAPREFSVWGMKSPTERGQQLGHFSYNIKESLVQTFVVKKSNSYEFVEFKVLSNQGNPDFTCIYRFRVHGKLERNNS